MDSVLTYLNTTTSIGILSLVITILIYLLLVRPFQVGDNNDNNKHKEPPMVSGAWPIIGHLPLLHGAKPLHITLGSMADKYGPLFTIKIGSRRVVVLSNSEMAKECFTKNDVVSSSRPILVSSENLGYKRAMFAFAPYGSYWRELRKIVTLELLSNRRIELLSHVRVSEVQASTKELLNIWSTQKNESGYVLVDIKKWFAELTFNIVLRMIAGKRFFGAMNSESEDKANECLKSLRESLRLLGLFTVGDAIPSLRWLDLGGHEKAMKKTYMELDRFMIEWLDEHRQKKMNSDASNERDFIDVMISVLSDAKIHAFDADTVTKATTLNMIIGATETTSITMTWAMCLLLKNPHTLENAKEELEKEIGKERCVSGYHIEKGTQLIANLWKINNDPCVWSNHLDFTPEKFLTTHKDVDVKGHHFELLPFGSGRRVCPGISFGLQMIHFILANFLHSFEISNPYNEPVDMSGTIGLVHAKATPLKIMVKPRLSPNCYETM
ncbi:hypothetical protein AHAS_Ahas15G0282500 [Arachis hypogaea]